MNQPPNKKTVTKYTCPHSFTISKSTGFLSRAKKKSENKSRRKVRRFTVPYKVSTDRIPFAVAAHKNETWVFCLHWCDLW